MSFLTAVKYKNRKTWMIAGISVAGIAVIVTAVILLLKSPLLYKKKPTDAVSYLMTKEMAQTVTESEMQKGYMFSRTEKLLMEDRGTKPWLLSWYVIPGTTRSVPALESRYIDTVNQVLLLQSYVIEGKKSKAETLMKAIESDLCRSDGYLAAFAPADDMVPDRSSVTVYGGMDAYEDQAFVQMDQAPASLEATSLYLRVLMDYYDKWGSEKLLDRIRELAEVVFETESLPGYKTADQLALPTPIPVSEDITPIPEPEPDPEDEKQNLVTLSGLEIPALDLEGLRRAAVMWPEYQERYEELLSIVQNAKISGDLPLYAWMYTGSGNYMYYSGSEGTVDLLPSLYTMVHLAQAGNLDLESYAWISARMYNDGFLYTTYDIRTGSVSSEVEAVEAYPLVLELAIIKGDDSLFDAAFDAIMRQYATLDTSQALYMIFRKTDDSRYAVYARENLLMEIYLR